LKQIQECEDEVAASVDNVDRMNEVLDRLQDLQEKAISKGAFLMKSS
jgi:hypothetical protein